MTTPASLYTDDAYYKDLVTRSKGTDDAADAAAAKSALEDINKQQFQQAYGGMGAASLSDFQTLLGRLESSKIRQQQAKDVSSRPNIYAQGLAQMMSNF